MASPEIIENLRNSFINLQKTVSDKITILSNAIHYGAAAPSSTTGLRLWVINKFGRTFIKYKINDTPSYIDIKGFSVLPSALETPFITTQNYGNGTSSTPIWGIRLKVPTVNSTALSVSIPTGALAQWSASAERFIDESKSYFKNTVSGKVITFSSMYSKGLEEVSIEDDSIVLTFVAGSSLSDWECHLCANYVG